jgi:subtilisin family serine protease
VTVGPHSNGGLRSGRRLWSVAVMGVALLLVPFAAASPAGATPDPIPDMLIVVGMTSPAVHASSVLGALPGSTPELTMGDRYELRVPEGEVAGVLATLRSRPGVSYAEVPQAVHAAAMPNDPCYAGTCGPGVALNCTSDPLGQTSDNPKVEVENPEAYDESGNCVTATQADLATVNAAGAWALTTGSSSVTVAVLDTGVDAGNPDLAGKVTVGPDVCATDDSGCSADTDQNGHGTHVSGTVGASTDNGTGIASLGWNTHVEMIEVLDSQGGGNTADVSTGIYDAVAAGDRVINLSLSNDSCDYNPDDCGPDPDEQAAVEYAQAHNVVVVAAAGNDGSSEPTYPASYPGVLSVAASDDSGVIQSFSQYGSSANIAAPGLDVLSTWKNNDYAILTGTSMAAPHVAAAAALVIAEDPALSEAQVVHLLTSTARPISGGDAIDGGELDAGAAVEAAASTPAAEVGTGYDEIGADGSVYPFGASPLYGSLTGTTLNRPIVGSAETPGDKGYWLVASDGGVFSFGDASFQGSTGNIRLNRPIVGMASTPDGGGYWLVASDGGIFAFGDAGFYGSTGSLRLNKPIVGMASTPDGRGYWLVASDGGIFAFGDAGFYGSTGSLHLNKPIVGMATTPDGGGYWLAASDGGIFSFGDAAFYGSTGSLTLNKPIVSMAATSDGGGYWLAASDGGIFSFGDAPFEGSTGGQAVPAPIVGLTS